MIDLVARALRVSAQDALEEWLERVDEPGVVSARVRWQADGTVVVESFDDPAVQPHYRITVLVEPAEPWTAGSWRDVADIFAANDAAGRVRVRLGGVEATVESAVLQAWHVDPRSNPRWPSPLEHEVVRVRLRDRGVFEMPPSGEVEWTAGPCGPALVNLLEGGFKLEPVEG